MAFQVYVSDGMDRLLDELALVLSESQPPPLKPEIISVQGMGMRAWLARQLAEHLGVWANFQFPFPRDLMRSLHGIVLGDRCPKENPFSREGLVWAIMAVLPDLIQSESFAPLSRYLAADKRSDPEKLRLYRLADNIADCFDQYTVYRPELIRAWDAGQDRAYSVGPDNSWQPVLWRAAVEQIAGGQQVLHEAGLGQAFVEALEQKQNTVAHLPTRVSLFGIGTLPPLYLNQLKALSKLIPVHLFYASPSEGIYEHLSRQSDQIQKELEGSPGREDLWQKLEQGLDNTALRSFIQQPLEFQALLQSLGTQAAQLKFSENKEPPTDSFLAAVKARLRDPAGQTSCPEYDPNDPSFSIHACHSPMREVEVVRDQLLRLFDTLPQLKPEHVVVMCPDMEKYAPLVEAAFDGQPGETGRIPFAISDRAFVRESPVAEAFMALLDLATSRRTLVEVFNLFSKEVIRDRCGLSENQVGQLMSWLIDAGVRWGVNSEHRASFDQPAAHEHTWRFGLERLLLGCAQPNEDLDLFSGCAPLDRCEGKAAQILGLLSEYLDTIFPALDGLQKNMSVQEWRNELSRLLELGLAADGGRAFGHQQIRDALEGAVSFAQTADFQDPVGLGVVRALLAGQFSTKVSGRGFGSGAVTFCKLLPMRSVPFRVVCLMGMNDQEFPREQRAHGFDLLARHPLAGDRSTRADDRHQFLEAVLSAQDSLVITYEGQNLQDNKPKPPAVVLSELLDAACSHDSHTLSIPTSEAREQLIVRHPLQAFSERYFQAERDPRICNFNKSALLGAQALVDERQEPKPFWAGSLSATDSSSANEVTLGKLQNFFFMPAKFVVQRQLGITFPWVNSAPAEREPLFLDKLEEYNLGTMLLSQGQRDYQLRARAQGYLPQGNLGVMTCDQLALAAESLRDLAQPFKCDEGGSGLNLDITLKQTRLHGSLDGLQAGRLISLNYGRFDGKRLLGFWMQHLALHASTSGASKSSILIARNKKGLADKIELAPLTPDQARAHLNELVALYLGGQADPLRFFPKTSWAFASEQDEEQALREARGKYDGDSYRNIPGEGEDHYVQRVFGHSDALTDLPPDHPLSFQSLARQVFGPVHELLGGDLP